MWSSVDLPSHPDIACRNTGAPNIAMEKKKSLSRVPRKNGSPATYDVIRPLKLRSGYMSGHAAHTAKLLIRKNETEVASAAPMTRTGPEFLRRAVPRNKMAAYHTQVTRWSQDRT